MDRTERFYRIELLLRNRGCVSFDALRDELEVSPATLKRDLQYLRDRMDAPIVYDRETNGYRFAAAAGTGRGGPGAGTAARRELPGLWFSEQEVHALLTMHQLLAGLDDDGVLARHLAPMVDKLQGMLGADAAEAREAMRRVKVIGTARRRAPSRHFELLGSALMQRRRVWLRYYKRSDRRESEREVSPQRLVHYRSTWYLDAWCHASEGLRRFALDAVREARALPARARHVAVKDLEAALDAGYGIYGGGARLRWAVLRFEADAAQWVSQEEWHPQQQSRWLDDGRYELRVPYGEATELAMDVLRHGDSVQVLGDRPLQRLIAERLHRAAAAYEPPAAPAAAAPTPTPAAPATATATPILAPAARPRARVR
ncbi:helix-turn-helix transcriptional regulator [Piscinibacter sakaiensis]|uniref:Putative transcriptional regulator n=1 Tax=Piscinibacter sakaiensis TaxID=1547922 RepID=A0A0K8NYS2_PISS1|nr:WYL domain-containing protein [Piscinibacter sakaiensis]GAP35065.1 putative transcriptional regulator [Piscinibacter sakaiensis]